MNLVQGAYRESGQEKKVTGAETVPKTWLQHESKVHPGGSTRGRAANRHICNTGKLGDVSVQGGFKDYSHGCLLL